MTSCAAGVRGGRAEMCGICGVVRGGGRPADPAALKRANDLISHRGPDDEGFFFDGPAGLAMRRLAIIDLNTGHQPLSYAEESLWIVFNGEIYNYQALRDGARSARPPLQDPVRHRGDPRAVQEMGAGLRDEAARHVRVRDLGQAQAPPVHRARPHRQEAARLCGAPRRDFGVRLGAALPVRARSEPVARGGSRRRSTCTCRCSTSRRRRRSIEPSRSCRPPIRSSGRTARPRSRNTGTCRSARSRSRRTSRKPSVSCATSSRKRRACA